ncbi:MAG: MHS family MFS transporter [Actinomycetota bacterium]|nr:MHS family MFS transporter [Actinomycetota bacterium]
MTNSTTGSEKQGDERDVFRVATVAAVAASIEWYDFFIYGTAAALVFPALFFPGQSAVAGALLSFATFGVGFLARPVGGVIFGHYGDLIGRKKTLVAALILMGVASTLIGLLPTYAVIGVAAPIILVALRFLQGVAVGGQQGGVVLLAAEGSPPRRRGFYGSFASVGAPGGVVLANLTFLLITATVSPAAFQSWGWRVPFLVSLVLIGLGIYIQLRLEDTPAFKRLQQARTAPEAASGSGGDAAPARRSPVLEAFRLYPRQVALSAGAYLAVNMTYYVFITFVISYGTKNLKLSQTTVLTAVLIASALQILTLPAAGAMSDRFGRRGVFMAGAVLLGVFSFGFWPMVDTASFPLILVALVIGLGLFHSMMYGPQPAFFAETFSTAVRYSGVSLGIQIGSVLGGAFAPLIATALLAEFGSSLAIGVYMAVACAITLVSVLLLTETHRSDIDAPHRDRVRG